MWILLWLQLVSGSFDHYHVGSYGKEDECIKHLEKAKVLVTSENAKVVCIFVKPQII